MLSSDEKKMLALGLEIRDTLGGHHFLQAELGAGANGIEKQGWVCRDCGLRAVVKQETWFDWMKLMVSVPDAVREVLSKQSCGVWVNVDGG